MEDSDAVFRLLNWLLIDDGDRILPASREIRTYASVTKFYFFQSFSPSSSCVLLLASWGESENEYKKNHHNHTWHTSARIINSRRVFL